MYYIYIIYLYINVYSNFQYRSYQFLFFLLCKKWTKRAKSELELSVVRVLALGVVRSIVRKNPTEQCVVVSCEWNLETIRGSTLAAVKRLRGRQIINVQQAIQCQKWSLLQNETESLFFSFFFFFLAVSTDEVQTLAMANISWIILWMWLMWNLARTKRICSLTGKRGTGHACLHVLIVLVFNGTDLMMILCLFNCLSMIWH